MATPETGGIAYLYIGGVATRLGDKASVNFGGIVKEPVAHMDASVSYTTKGEVPTIEVMGIRDRQHPASAMRNLTNVLVQVRMGDGTIYQIPDASRQGDLKIDLTKGTYDMTFFGSILQEV